MSTRKQIAKDTWLDAIGVLLAKAVTAASWRGDGETVAATGCLLVAGSPELVSEEILLCCYGAGLFTVAVDAGATQLVKAGLPVDLLVGDMDSIPQDLLAALKVGGSEVITANTYKDETDLQLALAAVIGKGCSVAVLLAVSGGRTDHQLAVFGAAVAVAPDLQTIIISDDAIVIIAAAGDVLDLSGVVGENQIFSIMALSDNLSISAKGCEWELEHEQLKMMDPRGVSNICRSESLVVSIDTGVAALVIPRYE